MDGDESSFLSERGIVAVGGADAPDLLHRLFTNSTLAMAGGDARYAAFLSPQGKLLFDFIVVAAPDEETPLFLLDCLARQAADLTKRLNFQKLRAKVTVTDRSAAFGVAAVWGAAPPPAENLVVRDPRHPDLGWRVIGPRTVLAAAYPDTPGRYAAHRIGLGVPQGGVDFVYGDAFAHDANLDHLHGVDFKKGCYVGQEVVARVHFRKSARKRIVPVRFAAPPASGAEVMAAEIHLGTLGSVGASEGLALLRLDRLAEAEAAGLPISAGGQTLEVTVPPALSLAAAKAHG